MAPLSSTELSEQAGHWLLAAARHAVARTLGVKSPEPGPAPAELDRPAACFVTLHDGRGRLRGCIGTLTASAPLAEAVGDYARKAAFEDPRFPPVTAGELPELRFEVSVLTEPEPVEADDKQALFALLRPGVDGLILRKGWRSATFLPQVWAQLPEPGDFYRALLEKAGLPSDTPPRALELARYQVLAFSESP